VLDEQYENEFEQSNALSKRMLYIQGTNDSCYPGQLVQKFKLHEVMIKRQTVLTHVQGAFFGTTSGYIGLAGVTTNCR